MRSTISIKAAESWLELPADHHAVAQRARSNLFIPMGSSLLASRRHPSSDVPPIYVPLAEGAFERAYLSFRTSFREKAARPARSPGD